MPRDPSIGNRTGYTLLGCEPGDEIFARRCKACWEYDCDCQPIEVQPIDEMALDPRALGLAYVRVVGRMNLARMTA